MYMIRGYAPSVKWSEQIEHNRPRLKATLISEGWSRRLQFRTQIRGFPKLSRNGAILRAARVGLTEKDRPRGKRSPNGAERAARGAWRFNTPLLGADLNGLFGDWLCRLPHVGIEPTIDGADSRQASRQSPQSSSALDLRQDVSRMAAKCTR
jgi:hypothetical protein